MDLAQYDKWVIGNQKRILDWTKMHSKERFAPIRDAFTAYHRAKSNKQKIQAFENLKKELVSGKGVKFNDLVNNTFEPTKDYLQGAADKFTKGDIDALDRNSNLSEKLKLYDDLAPLSEAMKSIPEKVKGFDWVELDKAFRDNYSYDEMKALAEKYNFDYKDPKERKEFIELLADMEQKRLKQDAYTPHDAAGMLTQIAYPVSMEYARKNDAFHPGAIVTDLVSQGVMAGGAPIGKAVLSPISEKAGEIVGGMLAAPLITEAGQAVINKKPIPEAVADAGVGIATNAFAPGGIKGMLNSFDAPFRWGEKGSARQAANKFVDELETIIRKQRSGTPYRHLENVSDRIITKFDAKKANALKNNEVFDANAAWKESEKEAYKELLDEYTANIRLTGKTDVFKERPFRKTKELTPKEVLDDESSILNITTDDDYKRNLVYNWRKNHPTEASVLDDTFKKEAAIKKINNEPWTAPDLINANITETPIHAAGRLIGRYSEPLASLGMNLGATTRLTDRKLGLMDRYLNLPWKYGEKEQREIDFSKPEVKAYMKAYGKYKASPDYFREPPKPKGYSDEEIEKIRKATEIVSIESIFGGE
jgi:hypothetical protein